MSGFLHGRKSSHIWDRVEDALQVEVRKGGCLKRQRFQTGTGAQRQVRHSRHMHLNFLEAVAILDLRLAEAQSRKGLLALCAQC